MFLFLKIFRLVSSDIYTSKTPLTNFVKHMQYSIALLHVHIINYLENKTLSGFNIP